MNHVSAPFVIGLVSDTHGLLRDSVMQRLHGVDLILHAGDIGSRRVVESLECLAPVRLVRGNTDLEPWSRTLPLVDRFREAGVEIALVHDVATLGFAPAQQGVSVVVSGHTHKPRSEHHEGVLWVNPGSAGPRRFSLPISIGRIILHHQKVTAELIPLDE